MIIIKSFFKNTFLFEGIKEDVAELLISGLNYKTEVFNRGEVIYSPGSFRCDIGFIVSGECEVLQHTSDGGKVIINTLNAGDSFGILTVFKDGDFPTEVNAKKKCEVLFISKEQLLSLIKISPEVSINIIRFLARKVSFLNGRLEATTLGSVEKKLASYLLNQSKELNSDTFTLNFKRCSETICAGRASVYRTIELLRNKGYIEAENRNIRIINKLKMEEFIK